MRSTGAQSTVGRLSFGNLQFRCALGRGGIRSRKREGDGATPRGTFKLEGAYWRSDALRRPQTAIPLRKTRPDDGWCDAANDRNYNCAVKHPYPASAERLWRQDRLYDVVVVIDYNRHPRVRAKGSAIFMHVAERGLKPTEGCVALARPDLLKLLARINRKTRIIII